MKLNIGLALGILLACASQVSAQKKAEVTFQKMNLEPGKETELYYGFAAGDKIALELQSDTGLGTVEIIEYPDIVRFSDHGTRKVKCTVSAASNGVYIFRVRNGGSAGNIRLRIARTPSGEATARFNTAVTWEDRQITTYSSYTKEVLAGYDTVYTRKSRKELVSTTLSEDMIMNRTERVHSGTNLDHQDRKTIHVKLPDNELSEYRTKEKIAWAYWIGVGKESSEAWSKNVKVASGIASGLSYFAGAGPLGKIAIGTITSLAIPTSGEDVSFSFIPDLKNAQLFLKEEEFKRFDKGHGVAAYGRNNTHLQEFYIGLSNDNYFTGIDVEVKVSVVWEIKTYEDRPYTEMSVLPRYQKQLFSEPVITTQRVPVTAQ